MPLQVPKTAKPKADPKCGSCKGGKHAGLGRCGGRCGCFCQTASVSYRPVPPVAWRWRDMTHVLQVLCDHGVACKVKEDGTVLWKPSPRTLPEHVQALMKEYRLLLAVALLPWGSRIPQVRPWWTPGLIATCEGCGQSCALYDPLGHCRHQWCGWVRQVVNQG